MLKRIHKKIYRRLVMLILQHSQRIQLDFIYIMLILFPPHSEQNNRWHTTNERLLKIFFLHCSVHGWRPSYPHNSNCFKTYLLLLNSESLVYSLLKHDSVSKTMLLFLLLLHRELAAVSQFYRQQTEKQVDALDLDGQSEITKKIVYSRKLPKSRVKFRTVFYPQTNPVEF